MATTQIKVTLPDQLYFFLKSKADRFGLTMSSYVKNLVIDDVKDENIPVFEMSEKLEKQGIQALKEYHEGNTESVENIEEYFMNL